MKRFLFVLILLISAQGLAQSQILISLLLGDKLNADGLEFGLEGGLNWSSIEGLETTDMRSTFNIGFYFDIRMKNHWYLYTGTLVKSSLGAANLSANDLNAVGGTLQPEAGSYDQEIGYFLVPIFLKYKFDNRIYLEAGPQVGLRNRSFSIFESAIDDP